MKEDLKESLEWLNKLQKFCGKEEIVEYTNFVNNATQNSTAPSEWFNHVFRKVTEDILSEPK